MIEVVNPGDDLLYVKKVIQKCFIEVDETGTKAAACEESDEDMGYSIWDPPPPNPRFVADHPFMFMIREDTSQAVFFMGVVATRILLDDAHNGFKDGNFVCSPFSLETVLGMLAAGAEGETLEQLLEFLGHETVDHLLSDSPSAKLLAQLFSDTDSREAGLEIVLANGIWVDKKLITRVQSRYKEVLQCVYKTEAKFVDFENMPHGSAKNINSWVNEKTRGLIPTIVDGGDLKDDVVIALVNALYFKGLWSKPFDAKKTKVKDFHLVNGETVSIPFMTSQKQFNYGCFEGCKILQIPYESEGQSNEFSMYIFLPDRKDGLQELLKVFHSDPALFHEDFYLEPRFLEKLWIPKFKISCAFEADNAVKQMGLTLPFKRTNKEFRRIVQPTGPEDNIYVSKILHKSFIEIDETGTEAAAVSCLFMGLPGCTAYCPPPPPPARFVADHPFLFMIREVTSQAVFFIGVVLNPHATD
uniref:serpin-Z3-like n=1 Tax=Erigeron canadensis TaxID=72917 RepID=UPI001CB8FE3B|nr:serpin-Z3-like [Erigeron canadensis]